MTTEPVTVIGGVDTHKHTHYAATLDGHGRLLTPGWPRVTSCASAPLPWWLVFARVASGRTTVGTGLSRSISSEVVSDKLSSYARSVDAVAEWLSPSEVAALRERGALPEWFFDAVEQEREHPGCVYR